MCVCGALIQVSGLDDLHERAEDDNAEEKNASEMFERRNREMIWTHLLKRRILRTVSFIKAQLKFLF